MENFNKISLSSFQHLQPAPPPQVRYLVFTKTDASSIRSSSSTLSLESSPLSLFTFSLVCFSSSDWEESESSSSKETIWPSSPGWSEPVSEPNFSSSSELESSESSDSSEPKLSLPINSGIRMSSQKLWKFAVCQANQRLSYYFSMTVLSIDHLIRISWYRIQCLPQILKDMFYM